MYTADRQCEDVRCKICCNADQSSHCNFHSNNFHCIASKAISIANHQPSEVDLRYFQPSLQQSYEKLKIEFKAEINRLFLDAIIIGRGQVEIEQSCKLILNSTKYN